MTADAKSGVKVRAAVQGGRAGFRQYRDLVYGSTGIGYAVWAEVLITLLGGLPGAAGLFLRGKLYRGLLGACGRKLIVGRNVTLRHPRKIRLGDCVVLDDNCLVDAKGTDNTGIELGDNVFIGRNSVVYCKNGDMVLERGVNVSSTCTLFSSNRLTIGAGTMIGAYTYILSGGEYDYADRETPFVEQSGMCTRSALSIGANCWLGARVTVLDGACIGEHCVVGAGAVVAKPIPADSLAVGVPARVVKSI